MRLAEHIIPVILAGGEGRRLFPLTHRYKPKPFVKMTKDFNFLQETLLRCAGFAPCVVVCQRYFVEKVLRSISTLVPYDVYPRAIVAEPMNKSTAPAIASAVMTMAPYMTFVVMPSDHAISDERELIRVIEQAAQHVARFGGIVSVGVKPKGYSKRFGYMHKGAVADKSENVCWSEYFVEKPTAKVMSDIKKKGDVLCNTGIFVARVYDYLQEFERIHPEYLHVIKEAFEQSIHYDNVYEPLRENYISLPNIPVDNAILEHCKARAVIEYKGYWSDVGTLPAFLKVFLLRLFGIIKL